MSEVSPVEFGRLIGHLESIQIEIRTLRDRTVWRLDNVEARVEVLENHVAAEKGAASKPKSTADQVWDWGLRAAVTGVIGYLLFTVGIG